MEFSDLQGLPGEAFHFFTHQKTFTPPPPLNFLVCVKIPQCLFLAASSVKTLFGNPSPVLNDVLMLPLIHLMLLLIDLMPLDATVITLMRN